ncbi:MAG: CDP-alcohol phosphatidyltransferase family protein [Acidobacteriota bacterium]|nr:CDP-alcohol phosphatidyltransferase family protein [Acidobacteriota bacterium]
MVDKAVILLRPGSGKKILGLPLFLRGILACCQAGFKSFYLIGQGNQEELDLIESIKNDRRILAATPVINYLLAKDFFLPGKTSSYELFDSPGGFLLLEGNVVFDPLILEEAKLLEPQYHEMIIFKASRQDDSGSNWTGLAVISKELLPDILSQLPANYGKGYKLLATLPRTAVVRYLSLPAGRFLLSVNSRAAGKEATRALLATARKPQDGFIAKYINRPISLFFSRILIRLGANPSLLSFINFLIGLGGAWLAALGTGYWSFLLAGLFFELASIFDGCDGEVARLTYTTSDKGALSDVILDASSYIIFFSCLDLGLYRLKQDTSYLTLMVIFLFAAAWYYYNLARYTRTSGIGKKIFLVAKEIEARPEKEKKLAIIDKVASRLAFTVRRDFFATFIFALLALGQATVMAYIISFAWLIQSTYFHFYVQKKFVQQSAEIN